MLGDNFCSDCGATRAPGVRYCMNCGAEHMAEAIPFDEEIGRTMIRPRVKNSPPCPDLVFDDGKRVPLSKGVLLGRSPREEAGFESVAIDDPDLLLSKTHARLEAKGDRIIVTDLNSTNGVRLSLPNGIESWLAPGEPTSVAPGSRLHVGSRSFLIEAARAAQVAQAANPPPPQPSGEAGRVVALPAPVPGPVVVKGHSVLPLATTSGAGNSLISSVPVDGDEFASNNTAHRPTADRFAHPQHPPRSAQAPVGQASLPENGQGRRSQKHVGQLDQDLRELRAVLPTNFAVLAAAAVEGALDAIDRHEYVLADQFVPRLIPGMFIGGAGPRFVGDGGSARFRRSYSLTQAAVVDLGSALIIALLDQGLPAVVPMRRQGISRVGSITMKRRLASLRALEWRYDDPGGAASVEHGSIERVVLLIPPDVPNGLDSMWHTRLHSALVSAPAGL